MISKDAFISALEEVDNAILAALPDPGECSFYFSDRFEQRMRSVIRRGNHPGIYKTLQRVACVLLVLLILFSSVMIFSADARAAVIGWIKEQYNTFYHYFFPSEATDTEQAEYTLGWIPNDYRLVDTQTTTNRTTQIYLDSQNHMLQFSYIQGISTAADYVDLEDYEAHAVSIGNNEGELFISLTPLKTNGIVLVDQDNNVLFTISAPVGEDDLIRLAEHIIILK